jgi:hypothetical protein
LNWMSVIAVVKFIMLFKGWASSLLVV